MVKVNETVTMWTILQARVLLRSLDHRLRASRGLKGWKTARKVTWKLARLQNSYIAPVTAFFVGADPRHLTSRGAKIFNVALGAHRLSGSDFAPDCLEDERVKLWTGLDVRLTVHFRFILNRLYLRHEKKFVSRIILLEVIQMYFYEDLQ